MSHQETCPRVSKERLLMRYCENEVVDVHEASGADLATLLREAADLVETHEGYAKVDTAVWGESADYLVTVYLH